MLIIDKKFNILKVKEIYFSNEPFDVRDCHGVSFFTRKNRVDLNGFTREDALTAIIDLQKICSLGLSTNKNTY